MRRHRFKANCLPTPRGLLLRGFRLDAAKGGATIERLPLLAHGPIEVEFRSALTFLIGENGSGKTTLLEALAARCSNPTRWRSQLPRDRG